MDRVLAGGSVEGTYTIEHLSYEDVVFSILFLCCIFAAGKLFDFIKMPGLIGEILIGSILGPLFINFVPEYFAFMLVGEIGLILLVVEAGLEIDLSVLKQIGFRGLLIGLVGSILPLSLGIGIGSLFGLSLKEAFAVGACVAPTSMGVAVVVLKEGKVLNTPLGQLIVAAAIADDVIALIILSELKAIATGNILDYCIPIISAIAFSTFFFTFAISIFPKFVRPILNRQVLDPELLLIGLIAVMTIGLMSALNYGRSSYLLGAFLAGLSFCTIPEALQVWHKQVKHILKWFLRIFFACTIGFQIPITSFWTAKVIGMSFAIFACVLGKLVMGFFAKPLNLDNFLTVGLAMSTWGEFAFIIAVSAKGEGVLSSDVFSSIVFAILLSILISPTLLRLNLVKSAAHSRRDIENIAEDASTHVYYKLYLRVNNIWGLQASILNHLSSFNLHCIDFHSEITEGLVVYESYLHDLELKDDTSHTEDATGLEDRISSILSYLDAHLMKKASLGAHVSNYTSQVRNKNHVLVRWSPTQHGVPLHVIVVTRWLPGSSEVELIEYGMDEEKAHARMHAEGFSPAKKLLEDPFYLSIDDWMEKRP